MKHKKVGHLANATCTENGILAPNGTLLIGGKYSKADCDEFNGKKKSKPKNSKK
jgi:hypothetical protein